VGDYLIFTQTATTGTGAGTTKPGLFSYNWKTGANAVVLNGALPDNTPQDLFTTGIFDIPAGTGGLTALNTNDDFISYIAPSTNILRSDLYYVPVKGGTPIQMNSALTVDGAVTRQLVSLCPTTPTVSCALSGTSCVCGSCATASCSSWTLMSVPDAGGVLLQASILNSGKSASVPQTLATNATLVAVVANPPYGDATVPLAIYTYGAGTSPAQLFVNRFNSATAKQLSSGIATVADQGSISGVDVSPDRKFLTFGSQTTAVPAVLPVGFQNTVQLFFAATDGSTGPTRLTPATVTNLMSGFKAVSINGAGSGFTANSAYYIYQFTDETDPAQTKTSLWSATAATTPVIVNLTPIYNETTGDPIGSASGWTVDCGIRALFYQTSLPSGAVSNVFSIALAGGSTVRLGFEPSTGITVGGWQIARSAFRIGFAADQFGGNDLFWNTAGAWMVAPSAIVAMIALLFAML